LSSPGVITSLASAIALSAAIISSSMSISTILLMHKLCRTAHATIALHVVAIVCKMVNEVLCKHLLVQSFLYVIMHAVGGRAVRPT
jgi:hypothetical protein